MAKNKELEVNVAATKWDGNAYSFISTLLLAILAIAFMVAIPVVAGVALGVFNVGGDKTMFLITLIMIVVFAMFGISWAIVIFMKWSVNNTVVNGQRLKLKACAFGLSSTALSGFSSRSSRLVSTSSGFPLQLRNGK